MYHWLLILLYFYTYLTFWMCVTQYLYKLLLLLLLKYEIRALLHLRCQRPPPLLCLSAALCARCLLITSVTIVCVWVVRGTPLFTELFCAMKLKHCTALAMDTWIALTHAPIVLGPSVCRGFVPPHYASTNYFWLSLFSVWNESLTWFIFFCLSSLLFLARSAVNVALMRSCRRLHKRSRHDKSHSEQKVTFYWSSHVGAKSVSWL